jgi:hypothetical protein
MGLNKWFILAKQAEDQGTRNNVKQLGSLYEAFLGAMFLDIGEPPKDNGIVRAEHRHASASTLGSRFDIVQRFVEATYEKHINWADLIRRDDNKKGNLQMRMVREFKQINPFYKEISPYTIETGHHMGVYLCIGLPQDSLSHENSLPLSQFTDVQAIKDYVARHQKILVCLGDGRHSVKREAEQIACAAAIDFFDRSRK